MRRKGELSPNDVDYSWPHQVSLTQEQGMGPNFHIIRAFTKDLGMCERGHTFYRDGIWHNVYCFTESVNAEKFQKRFGGEWFDPKTRGRGSRWAILRNEKGQYPTPTKG